MIVKRLTSCGDDPFAEYGPEPANDGAQRAGENRHDNQNHHPSADCGSVTRWNGLVEYLFGDQRREHAKQRDDHDGDEVTNKLTPIGTGKAPCSAEGFSVNLLVFEIVGEDAHVHCSHRQQLHTVNEATCVWWWPGPRRTASEVGVR